MLPRLSVPSKRLDKMLPFVPVPVTFDKAFDLMVVLFLQVD